MCKPLSSSKKEKRKEHWARVTAQWLRALSDITKDPDYGPASTQEPIPMHHSTSRKSQVLFWPLWEMYTYIHICR